MACGSNDHNILNKTSPLVNLSINQRQNTIQLSKENSFPQYFLLVHLEESL